MEYANYTKALVEAGALLQKRVRLEINVKRRKKRRNGKSYTTQINSSGDLARSIQPKIRYGQGNKPPELDIIGNDYAEFVNDGRKAGSFTPIAPLMNWIKVKPLRLRDANGKFVKMDDAKIRSAAHGISKNHFKYGIAPTNFLTDAVEATQKKVADVLAKALAEDIAKNTRE